jgi:copper chaperone CopZ
MKTSIIIQNLKCGGCAKTITSKLSELDIISHLTVDVETSTLVFEHNSTADALALKDRLKSLGYPSMDDKNSIGTKAMSFVSSATGKMSKA